MRVMDMDLPKTAGAAKLQFLPPKELPRGFIASRDKEEIFLMRHESSRFYPLVGGSQFLFSCEDSQGERSLYFGGMDESPFLVQLEASTVEHLLDGEEAFFEALKPRWIRNAERESRRKAKRQGDFFAFSSTKDMSTFLKSHMQRGNKATVQIVENMQLEGTRHHLSGLHVAISNRDGSFLGSSGEGVIEAPDHAPLKLESPHIIMQALHLVRPEEAD
jgi:hypothetical protein